MIFHSYYLLQIIFKKLVFYRRWKPRHIFEKMKTAIYCLMQQYILENLITGNFSCMFLLNVSVPVPTVSHINQVVYLFVGLNFTHREILPIGFHQVKLTEK